MKRLLCFLVIYLFVSSQFVCADDSRISEGDWDDDQGPEQVLVFEDEKYKRSSLQKPLSGLIGGRSPLKPPCGKCSPERNACQIVSGIFTRTILPYGYSLVTTIPGGVCNISVVESKPSKNYFALRNNDGSYVLNGNWDLQAAGTYRIGGTFFHYSPSDGTRGEKLESLGPLIEQLDLMIIYQSKNPGIKYEYRIPLPDIHNTKNFPVHHNLKYTSRTQISPSRVGTLRPMPPYRVPSFPKRPMGPLEGNIPPNWNSFLPIRGGSSGAQGVQRSPAFPGVLNTEPRLLPNEDINSVDNHRTRHSHGNVADSVPPAAVDVMVDQNKNLRPQNSQNFRPQNSQTKKDVSRKKKNKKGKRRNGKKRKNRFAWVFKGLSHCSRSCGGGEQNSIFSCERKRKGKVVADKFCQESPPTPKAMPCNLNPCPAQWIVEDWGPCSASCGHGLQTRSVHCKQQVSQALTMMVPEGACFQEHNFNLTKGCNDGDCPPLVPHWHISNWEKCSADCGIGTKSRVVECRHQGAQMDDAVCLSDGNEKPRDNDSCDMGSCVKQNSWMTSAWSRKCTDDCGNGLETRTVVCLQSDFDSEDICSMSTRPDSAKPCSEKNDCGPIWFSGPWSSCSVSCGTGFETRIIKCLIKSGAEWTVGLNSQCPPSIKPLDSRECFQVACEARWFTSKWKKCSSNCGIGIKSRDVTCLDSNLQPSTMCSNVTRPPEDKECRAVCSAQWKEKNSSMNSNSNLLFSGKKRNIEETQSFSESKNESLEETDDNQQDNELQVSEKTGNDINAIPDTDAQGDQSVTPLEAKKKKKKKLVPGPSLTKGGVLSCVDRIKNCQLVFRARLCRLKYYNKLCCSTCKS